MALATKCPHCNTVFRVAHDQLKLRGGIVRCGACNEVFDGNAALLEPLAPPPPPPVFAPAPVPELAPEPTPTALPEPSSFDQKMAALDTRAAETLSGDTIEPIYTLELDTAMEPGDVDVVDAPEAEPEFDPVSDFNPAPAPAVPAAAEPSLDLDLDVEPPPVDTDLDTRVEPQWDDAPTAEAAASTAALEASETESLENALSTETMSDEALETALEEELALMDKSITEDTPAAEAPDDFPELHTATAIDTSDSIDDRGRREPTWDEPHTEPAVAAPALPSAELDEVDEEALVQLSSAAMTKAQVASAHAHLLAVAAANEGERDEDQDTHGDHTASEDEDPEEPGFVKRARKRQKFGKASTIGMSVGAVLLLAALAGQGLTTYRNQLAAAVPPLRPGLLSACVKLGCTIELPSQIDELSIEQGELQTLSDTTFSFTTLLRNQAATAQAWPHIELVLDDAADKHILRRVFSPRDYLGPDVALDKGFAPHTEQSVKLYFELSELKASGYHIAVFYP